ncbi:mechanosensitive ion channel domain-containing protein [Oerskovia paurometabola]|uniref:Mechanosensitive ion channel domain-containing protein n=1 Tax=Oerskovia paurometabola TaxID=162170 RepID=A0ABW1XET7_9CELL|nr:mechanosensitive ion channel family protein [Oerskovia paurometabola]MBM7495413.1 small-conductance mechanosensitive channel [Oerskovia paurometabola]
MVDTVSSWFADSDVSGWDVVLALLAVLGAWLLSRLARRGVRALGARTKGLSPQVLAVAERVVHYAVLLVGIGLALAFLGFRTEPILGAVIVVVIVAVLALRGIADNFGAAIILQTRTPVRLGDEIESLDWTGVVKELNGRSVVIATVDGREVHLPNAAVLGAPLVNHSVHGARRSTVEVRLEDARPGEIATTVLPAVVGAHGVHRHPAPDALTIAAEPTRTTVHVRFWHAPKNEPHATSAVVAAVGEALRDRHGEWVVTGEIPAQPFVPPSPV